jgi:hypothetical protein
MWKYLGVVCLWVSLLALPHFGPTVVEASLPGTAPALAVASEDPGDPPLVPQPTRREIPGSFATIHFKNELGKTLSLLEARVALDGQALPVLTNFGAGDDAVVFAGRVSPGHHLMGARLVCQGKRRGVFTYLKDYKWDVTADAVLTVPEDDAVIFTVAATRKKGINVPLDKQVSITVRDEIVRRPLSLAR